LSFNPNIPLVTDKILQSAGQLRANFRSINNAFSDNHVGLTQSSEKSGLHNVLTLRTTTDPTTSATQTAIYNKLVATIPAMFYRPSSDQTPIQMTYPSIQTGIQTAPSTYYAQQYSFCAGPFIIYGGLLLNVTNPQTVNLSPGTTLLSVELVIANPINYGPPLNIGVAATNIAGTSFDITASTFISGTEIDIYYLAIGV